MASTIKIKRSSVAGKSPTTSDISAGELALNIKDQKLYSSNGSAVFEIGGGGGGSAANGFSGILVGANVVVADSSTDRLTITAGTRINIAANPTTDTITFSASTNDYLQVANASSIYQTKAVERAALANTNAYIATKLNSSSYTASDVLSKLITVDGAGSGLDADLLDGQSSAYFAVAATENSRLANTNAYIATRASWTALTSTNTALRTLINDRYQVANVNTLLAAKATWSGLTGTNTALRTLISDRLQVANAAATYQTKTVERAALANTNSYIATQATRITLVNTNLVNTNTAIRTLVNARLQVANATTLLAAKATWTGLTATNTALRTLISDRLQVANASSIYQTKAVERAALANTNAYIATKLNSSSYTASDVLSKLITVDGTGSGLDADTLDGVQGSAFLRTDGSTVATGIVRFGGNLSIGSDNDVYLYESSAGAFSVRSGSSGSYNYLTFSAAGALTIGGSTVWHAGNDGSGSGLDADLWDGNQFASYLNQAVLTSSIPSFTGLSVTNTITGYVSGAKFSNDSETKDDITTRTESGFFQTSTGTTGEGWPITNNTWQHLISVTHSNDSNYYSMQIAGSFYDNVFYGRKTNGSGSASWVKFWTDGNDGSGSGLDADLLDGLDSGQFMRDDASATNTVDLRAPIFYDSNDTSVYLDGGTLVLRNSSPTIFFRDTDHNSAMIHVNSNEFYILRGGNDTTTATQVNSQWPLTINLTNNNATFGGSISAIGNITAYASDIRLKENIVEIPNAIEKIKKIRGVTFDWKDTVDEVGFTPDTKYNDLGVIAQEIQAVIPQAVVPAPFDAWVADPRVKYSDEELAEKNGTSKSGENYLTVNLEKIVPLLIEGIKEQQSQIEVLRAEINILKGVN